MPSEHAPLGAAPANGAAPDPQDKHKKRRLQFSLVTLIILAVAASTLFYIQYSNEERILEEADQLNAQAAQLESENARLRQLMNTLCPNAQGTGSITPKGGKTYPAVFFHGEPKDSIVLDDRVALMGPSNTINTFQGKTAQVEEFLSSCKKYEDNDHRVFQNKIKARELLGGKFWFHELSKKSE